MFSAMTWMKKRWGSNKEAASMALKVTSAQLKAIFALSRKLGMDMEDLHGMADRISGTDSLRTLSGREAGRMIEELKTRCGQPVIRTGGGAGRALPPAPVRPQAPAAPAGARALAVPAAPRARRAVRRGRGHGPRWCAYSPSAARGAWQRAWARRLPGCENPWRPGTAARRSAAFPRRRARPDRPVERHRAGPGR